MKKQQVIILTCDWLTKPAIIMEFISVCADLTARITGCFSGVTDVTFPSNTIFILTLQSIRGEGRWTAGCHGYLENKKRKYTESSFNGHYYCSSLIGYLTSRSKLKL